MLDDVKWLFTRTSYGRDGLENIFYSGRNSVRELIYPVRFCRWKSRQLAVNLSRTILGYVKVNHLKATVTVQRRTCIQGAGNRLRLQQSSRGLCIEVYVERFKFDWSAENICWKIHLPSIFNYFFFKSKGKKMQLSVFCFNLELHLILEKNDLSS